MESIEKHRHANNHYILKLYEKYYIDARDCGNMARFINHSCSPNCEIRLWDIKATKRVGIYSKCMISPGTQLTIDYKFDFPQPSDLKLIKCYCESPNCSVYFGNVKKQMMKYVKDLSSEETQEILINVVMHYKTSNRLTLEQLYSFLYDR